MVNDHPLRERLESIDGRDYGAYRSLRGVHRFERFDLDIDRVPSDPYAPPGTGVFRVRVPNAGVGLTEDDLATPARDVAVRDHLCRRFHAAAERLSGGRRGTGWSGVITVARPGQAVLDRNAVLIAHGVVELRAFVGLPARGRRIDADLAATVLLEELPTIVAASLSADTLDRGQLERHVRTVEDARSLRAQLTDAGLVAFLADEAVLPRASGVDDRPLGDGAIPLASPDALRMTLEAPHAGAVTGIGIRRGVTVIVGGGYHGKSTLLAALGAGVYDHIAGDGRERCVSLPETFPARAAPGRSVAGVDISAFIQGLPDGRDTTRFTTPNASGSTSQAAAISEAIEAGAQVLLVDEDSSATNLLVRDARMQALVAREDEPITVLLDRVRDLHDQLGVSTVLVLGGAGDYLDVADHVIQMVGFAPREVTQRAREVAAALPSRRRAEAATSLRPPRSRIPAPGTIETHNEHGKRRVRPVARDRIVIGSGELDLRDVADQLTEPAQTATVAAAIERLADALDGSTTVVDAVGELFAEVSSDGLDALDEHRRGRLAEVRALDIAAALNRLRTLGLTAPSSQ
ncbi:MAG: ABC-ATPase domain-containing protein [Actinobacteria bacterium]|nr:ABC-ATPase domain-containing protein [Actinomycetota bacterium]